MRNVLLALTALLAACASVPPLEWPAISPNFAKLDEGRILIYKRIELAKPIEANDALHTELLVAVKSAHEEALAQRRGSYSVQSSLKDFRLIDPANAVITYEVITRPSSQYTDDQGSLYVYALARQTDAWTIVAKYQLTRWQVVS